MDRSTNATKPDGKPQQLPHLDACATGDDQTQAPTLPGIAPILRLQKLQLTGVEEVHRILDEDIIPRLVRLEQRPSVDIEAITQPIIEAIDTVDRSLKYRVPKLINRRLLLCWLWFSTGLLVGIAVAYMTAQTTKDRQLPDVACSSGTLGQYERY